ncbi:MAG: Abi family protein [Campylobacterota bacterium]|nr:Abi family protein [Campylobacterota bacterium]
MLNSQLQQIKNNHNTYNKPHLTFEQQLEHLKSNGLIVPNESYALKKLSHINYYRLSAYSLAFKYPKETTKTGLFYEKTEFKEIIKLYDFDAKLRRILFGALEIIEVYIRTQITYHHAKKYGAFGYLDKNNFNCNDEDFDEIISNIKKESRRSDEKFINHFKNKYGISDLPLWSIVEILSFGTISKIFTVMKQSDKIIVCENLPINHKIFKRWMHSFTILRNICAHHSRAWNRELRVPFAIPSKNTLFDPLRKITKSKFKEEINGKLIYKDKEFDNNNSIFFALSVMKYIFDSIGEEVDFITEIKQLLSLHPKIDLKAMGFIDGWENFDIWNDI